jgi:hypothetical protein
LVKFERWAERQRTGLFSFRSFTSAVSRRSIAGEGNGEKRVVENAVAVFIRAVGVLTKILPDRYHEIGLALSDHTRRRAWWHWSATPSIVTASVAQHTFPADRHCGGVWRSRAMVMDRSTLGRNILLLERKRLITILVAVLHPPVAFRFFAGLYYVPAMPQPRPCRGCVLYFYNWLRLSHEAEATQLLRLLLLWRRVLSSRSGRIVVLLRQGRRLVGRCAPWPSRRGAYRPPQ